MTGWAALVDELASTGWRVRHLDARADPSRAATLEALGRALDLPSWWGRNLDALADCLAGRTEPAGERTLLLWDGWAGFAAEDPRASALVRRLLVEAGVAVLVRDRARGTSP